ncbi:MAG: MBL fold metallo-hydrolase [Gelidibacter sp.]
MKKIIIITITAFLSFNSCKGNPNTTSVIASEKSEKNMEAVLKIIPINHATMVLEYENMVIYVDPVGGSDVFKAQKQPDFVLITDIHGDHLDAETLKGLNLSKATLIVPQAVKALLPKTNSQSVVVLNNTETKQFGKLNVEAIPMYNLRKEALKFHPKGRGNGYVLTLGNERIYISGDTEDIPEMRQLKNIDVAFVCMNLPYTMTVESAASAVLDFKPKKVYPYHYRGTEGLSDVAKFKSLVNKENKDIEVIQLNWYE